MKVVHLIQDENSGGAGIAAKRLSSALGKIGIHSSILSLNNEELKKNSFKNKLFFIFERLIVLPFIKSRKNLFSYSFGIFGRKLENHSLLIHADIIHLHWVNFGFLNLKSIKEILKLKKPVVWTFHDMWAFTGGCHYSYGCTKYTTNCKNCPQLNIDPLGLSENCLEKKSEILNKIAIVSPSNWMKDQANKSPFINSERNFTIPNPIDTKTFIHLNKEKAREYLKLDKNEKYILFGAVNLKDERKGAIYFFEAIQYLSQEFSEFTLLTFGKNELVLPFKNNLKIINIGLIKNQEVLIQLYNASTVFVTTSIADNLPNVVVEALSCGIPCVAFNLGGFPDLIKHKYNGFLADPYSPQSIANGIKWSFDNENIAALNARNYAIENYEEIKIAHLHSNLYSNLLPISS